MDLARASDRIGARFRQTDVTSESTLHQPRHRANRFFDWNFRIDSRHAKEVETIDAEPLDALFTVLSQVFRRAATAITARIRVTRAAGFGMNHDPLAPAFERLIDQFMIVPAAV